MKKTLTFLLVLLATQLAFAQEEKTGTRIFRKFKTDVSIGIAIPQGSGIKGGLIFVIEPKYAVLDQLSLGLRLEGATLANVAAGGGRGEVRGLYSYLATGDYYFSNNKFRPFAGAGAGIFTLEGIIEDNGEEIQSASEYGFITRAGFELGHFRMGAEYNFLKNKKGYLGIKIGAVIGGGRK